MSKKIVYFDKEVFEQKIKGWIERRTYVTSKDFLSLIEGLTTEIDTDQSIEERAEKKYPDAIVTINLAKKMRYIEGATEQDLISKARERELFKQGWLAGDDFSFQKEERLKEAFDKFFNQFTNR